MAWPSPTWARTRSTVDWMKCSGVQSALAPQMSSTKLRSSSMPWRRVGDFGMKLHGPDAARSLAMPASAFEVFAVRTKPSGKRFGLVAVAHPDVEGAGQAAEERRFRDDLDLGVAVLARRSGFHACRRGDGR